MAIGIFATTFLVMGPAAYAAEVIKRFHSEISVAKDGTFSVTETIQVRSEGRQIRRGIYRDFPLYFEDETGARKKVGFELLSVTRDGKPDGKKIENIQNGVRIYIGKSNVLLQPGEYTYQIRYNTSRQMRYFDEYDEVYWNATGNFWSFPIEQASATLKLPSDAMITETRVFTGGMGSTKSQASIDENLGQRSVQYTAQRVLNPGEGMTILAKVEKGGISPPSDQQRTEWFWQDNRSIILASLLFVLLAAYYGFSWFLVGRDPPGGVILPRWNLPDGVSPAMVSYIEQKGLSGKGFDSISAAILNLAIKGYVILSRELGDLVITSTGKSPKADLPVGELAVIRSVGYSEGASLKVSSENGKRIKVLQSRFATAMEKEHRNKFYNHNAPWTIAGIALSIFGLFAVVWLGKVDEETVGILFFTCMFCGFVTLFALHFVKLVMSAGTLVGKIFAMVFAAIFVFVFLSGGFFTMAKAFAISGIGNPIFVIVIGIVVLNVLFFFLLGAPTRLGRKRMDEIEGLRTYLTLAEKERLNLPGVPDFSVVHFEKLLPYAVALGVEKPWSKAFDAWLATAVAAGAVAAAGYSPRWNSGWRPGTGNVSDTIDDFTRNMQSDFSNAMPVPKSSSSGFSSGGGGFSGGGGGGGGGGGW